MSIIPKVRRSSRRSMIQLEVRSVERLSPHFQRVTLGGDELAGFEHNGPDQGFRMFFPRPGQERLLMPTIANEAWMAQLIMQPTSKRPFARIYTARAVRPEARELDVELVLHDGALGASAATRWASSVAPGDPVGIFDEGYTYQPPPETRRQLIVGDESALPAILAILERAPSSLEGVAYVEVPTDDDVRARIVAPGGVKIHWIPRNDPTLKPGGLALDAVRAAHLDPQPDYTWVAGESSLATGVRRHLTRDRNIDKSTITFTGYWRHGHGAPG